jgi:bacterioferritin
VKNKAKIVDKLQEALASEFQAHSYYLCVWAYLKGDEIRKLGKYFHDVAKEEKAHIVSVMDRLSTLGETPQPDMTHVEVQESAIECVNQSEKLELEAVELYRELYEMAAEFGDPVTAKLAAHICEDEEDHAQFLGAQIELHEKLGEQNWLAEWL